MFKINDKVITLRSTGWTRKGWTGRVVPQKFSQHFLSIKILWDNGKESRVLKDTLGMTNKNNDPNMAFRIRKQR